MLNNYSFIGCDKTYEEADVVLFGAPFDSTTSYRPGTRFAAKAMRTESFSIETYSPYQDGDLEEASVHDAFDLDLPFGSVTKSLDMIEAFCEKIVADGKFPYMIGGEHLVTLGAIRALSKRHKNLKVLHFDAHTDLRDDYLGEPLSHATVMRRVHDLLGDFSVHSFGIRSGEKSEFEWAKTHIHLQKFNLDGLDLAISKIGNDPVYISIDLDVIDPSEFPGTGTPEAGGISFLELLGAVLSMRGMNIVGADLNELCPIYDQSGVSTSLACKMVRETIISYFKRG